MSKLHAGLDFGTTNSSAAVTGADGEVRVLAVDPRNPATTSMPSMLYVTCDGEHIVGRAALEAFIERNEGREVYSEYVDLDVDIPGYVGAEIDSGAGDGDWDSGDFERAVDSGLDTGYRAQHLGDGVVETVQVRAIVEANSPGRVFQSLKTYLSDRSYQGSIVFGTHYHVEQLIAPMLRPLKDALDEAAGESVEHVVMGRPVRFSLDEQADGLAEERLLRAARMVGFKDVTFFYEPVAACIEYAVASNQTQKLMVVDIGGGTCDVCVMEFGAAGTVAGMLGAHRVLSVAGVPVAGNALDQEIIRRKLFPLFGSQARYGPARLRLPQSLFNRILNWQSLYKLNTEEDINWLIAAEHSSDDPAAIRRLRRLIQLNSGCMLARNVEQAKCRLTDAPETTVGIAQRDLHLESVLNREEFRGIIAPMLEDMMGSVVEAEKRAGVGPGDIDLVLTTGGTSLIPAIRQMLASRFGHDRLVARDTFRSVASGLAVAARHIQTN